MLGIHSQIGAALARLILPAAFGLAGLLGLISGATAQSCSVTAASGSFGSLDVLPGTAVNSSSTFSASCTGTANRTVRLCIELGRGASAAGPSGERALTTGTNYLDFEFYSDAARTLLWGSWGSVVTAYGTGGVSFDLALGAAGSANRTFTVYSRVLAGQSVRVPGTYTWTGSSPGMIYGYAAAAACPTGGATTTSGGTTWTATVISNCNVSVTPLNFGTSPSNISANLDSTATITAQCTNTTPYSIGLDNGTNAAGSQRRMRLGATSNYLNYALYTDSARSNSWVTSTSATACSSGSGTCVLGTGTGLNQSVSIYGRVAPQTAPAAGSFSDTVVVTITF